jgi:hypothetical protein
MCYAGLRYFIYFLTIICTTSSLHGSDYFFHSRRIEIFSWKISLTYEHPAILNYFKIKFINYKRIDIFVCFLESCKSEKPQGYI